jgi:hypothetical protein
MQNSYVSKEEAMSILYEGNVNIAVKYNLKRLKNRLVINSSQEIELQSVYFVKNKKELLEWALSDYEYFSTGEVFINKVLGIYKEMEKAYYAKRLTLRWIEDYRKNLKHKLVKKNSLNKRLVIVENVLYMPSKKKQDITITERFLFTNIEKPVSSFFTTLSTLINTKDLKLFTQGFKDCFGKSFKRMTEKDFIPASKIQIVKDFIFKFKYQGIRKCILHLCVDIVCDKIQGDTEWTVVFMDCYVD